MRRASQILKDIRKAEAELAKAEKSTQVNHILHLLLSIITGGLWLIVWIALALNFNTATPRLRAKVEALHTELDEATDTQH